MKTKTFEIKTLNGATMKIGRRYGLTMLATIRYNNHILHVVYRQKIPLYKGGETVKVTDKIAIDKWYYIKDDYTAVHDELLAIFESLTA